MSANVVTLAMVDDDPDEIFLIKQGLSQLERNVSLLEFLSGQSLFSHLEGAASVDPDLILLDINMPRMNGFEVLKRLKGDERWLHIPVIILTTSNNAMDRDRCLEAGAEDLVTKFSSLGAVRGWLKFLVRLTDNDLRRGFLTQIERQDVSDE